MANPAKKHAKSGALKLYKTYNFVDKDPIIDRMRTMVQREGIKYSEIHARSGVTPSTMHNWFDGKTRRPQFATVMAVVHALGYKVVYVKRGGKS
jgi:DNA-binding phage protein